jgi:Family of unknown function (DUF6801)
VRSRALVRLRSSRTRALAGVLVAGAMVSASALAADASPAETQQVVRARLAYNCRFPSGERQVSVMVAGTFPSAMVASQPMAPATVRTVVTLPRSAVADLSSPGAAGVTGRDVLSVSATENAQTVTTRWPGRVQTPVPVPPSGPVDLAFSGAAPPVTASAPGTVTLTPTRLTLALGLLEADRTPANPPGLLVACAPEPGKEAAFAAVRVAAAATHGGRPAKNLAAQASGGGIASGCAKRLIQGGTTNPVLGCAYLAGYADVLKLKEAALVGPGPHGSPPAALLHTDTYASDIGCVPKQPTLAACIKHHGVIHVYSCTVAHLDYRKQLEFPPARATFLNFGFVPVTAMMQLAETTWPRNHPPAENPKCYTGFNKGTPVALKSPVVTVFSDLNDSADAKFPVLNISETYLTIHISQVAVNGVPLNVGADCATTEPVHAVLTGHGHNGPPPTGYTLDLGGPLTGNVTIPQFKHCGVGENLDPLFNAAISGSGNFQLMTQGTLCTPQQSGQPGCPPTVPKPRRHA